MDPMRNPFSPGAGSRPPELAGRDRIIEDAKIALGRVISGRNAQSQILLGLRGTGKTVLLNEIENTSQEMGYISSFIEAPENETLAEMLYPQMRQVLRKLSIIEKARVQVNEALSALRNFASIFKISYGDFEIGIDPTPGMADSGNIEYDLIDMFLSIGNAAKKAEKGWALFIDEVQYLKENELAALIVSIHRISQKGLPVIFFAAGLPQIARLSGDARSYSERLFIYPKVGALDRDDSIDAIKSPLDRENVIIEDNALNEILSKTSGYPFFLQEWGYQAWNTSEGESIFIKDVEVANEKAFKRLDDSFFRVRLDRLTNAELEYVRAMAGLGQGPYKSADVAAALNRQPNSLGPCRAGIISKGMIYSPSYGEIDFTVPLFDDFLRRNS